MKRFLSVFLSAALLLSLLAGCGGGDTPADGGSADAGASSDAGGSTGGGHKSDLIIGTAADINNLNLQEQQDAVNNIILKTTHENLVRFTNEGTCVPCIATEWEYLDDTHIQFKLVENAHFSTGEPLTAEDVKFTYDMAKDSYVASVLSTVVTTDGVDDYPVVSSSASTTTNCCRRWLPYRLPFSPRQHTTPAWRTRGMSVQAVTSSMNG